VTVESLEPARLPPPSPAFAAWDPPVRGASATSACCGSAGSSAVLGIQIQSSALLWQVYEIAAARPSGREASLYLGLVGLCQFLPLLA
jgi:hypothetical protein